MSYEMAAIPVALPQIDEQQKICAYLDCKCGQVDTLIENVSTQIEKLKAYKQSLISEIVTKGIDFTLPTKNSGIEYIGEINEKFETSTIGSLFFLKKDILGKEP